MVEHKSDRENSKKETKSTGRSWPDWYPVLASFRNPDKWKAVWQLTNTLVPYCFLWYLMVRSIQLGYSYIITLILALIAAAFLVRIFILFHDCVHGSFFMSKYANTFFGYLLGVLVFTSFEDWRFSHLRHHASFANLDKRGFGDVWTITKTEYEKLPKKKQLQYRFYRSPVVLIGLGAFFIFVLSNRIPTRSAKRKERMSILLPNLIIIAMVLAAAWGIGLRTYLLIQLPVLCLAGAAGIWLFYVQHQFPGGYWARKNEWEPLCAAMKGSSFYKLPAVLSWFSGNIGYHHVHHLSSRIPNYNLKKCYAAVPALQAKAPLTIVESLSCIKLKMWDEKQQEMVTFL